MATEDYAGAVHLGLKHVMGVAAKATSPITDQPQFEGALDAEWALAAQLFVLLKRKTTGEAKTLVTSAVRDNGFESWRILVSRFEPQAGIKRMKEVSELMSLQKKRCKNTAETALILLEMGRSQKLIAEIGGTPVAMRCWLMCSGCQWIQAHAATSPVRSTPAPTSTSR